MWVALDTNVLVYAEGVNGLEKKAEAWAAINEVGDDAIVIPVQVLGELFNVLTRKTRWAALDAKAVVDQWTESFRVVDTTLAILNTSIHIAQLHQLQIWDAIILSAAAHARCTELLSEDMQHGFTWRGVTVRNPFRPREGH